MTTTLEQPLETMNGQLVYRTKETVFVRIPNELARPIDGGCKCAYCAAHPHLIPRWDMLALSVKEPKNGRCDYANTVHCPDAWSVLEGWATRTTQKP